MSSKIANVRLRRASRFIIGYLTGESVSITFFSILSVFPNSKEIQFLSPLISNFSVSSLPGSMQSVHRPPAFVAVHTAKWFGAWFGRYFIKRIFPPGPDNGKLHCDYCKSKPFISFEQHLCVRELGLLADAMSSFDFYRLFTHPNFSICRNFERESEAMIFCKFCTSNFKIPTVEVNYNSLQNIQVHFQYYFDPNNRNNQKNFVQSAPRRCPNHIA